MQPDRLLVMAVLLLSTSVPESALRVCLARCAADRARAPECPVELDACFDAAMRMLYNVQHARVNRFPNDNDSGLTVSTVASDFYECVPAVERWAARTKRSTTRTI